MGSKRRQAALTATVGTTVALGSVFVNGKNVNVPFLRKIRETVHRNGHGKHCESNKLWKRVPFLKIETVNVTISRICMLRRNVPFLARDVCARAHARMRARGTGQRK